MTDQLQTIPETLQKLLVDFLLSLPNLLAAAIIFIFALYLSSLISRAVRKAMERRSSSSQAVLLLTKIAYWSVLILGTIAALQQVGFNLTAFLAGLGIVGFTIGFALQDVSKNFVSGLMLLIQRPFYVGESVEVTGFGGQVIAVDLRATEIHTFDGRVVMIPNADIITSPIINYSRASQRRLELNIGVSYESDLEKVRRTALQALARVPGVLEDPAPQVNFHTFGASTIDLTLYYWIDTRRADILAGKDAALTAVKQAFDKDRIEIPYPVQTVYYETANGNIPNPG